MVTRQRLKKVALWLHKQLGIWLGLLMVLLGLTGSALVFMEDLEPLLYPQQLQPGPPITPSPQLSPDHILKTLEQQLSTGRDKILRLYSPTDKYPIYRAVVTTINEAGKSNGDFYFHYISPHDGKYLGTHLAKTHNPNQWHMPLFRLLLGIHTHLMVGHYGELLIGIVGLFFLLTLLLGYYLWWPNRRQRSASRSSIFAINTNKGSARLLYDLHRQVGFFMGFLLLIACVSGIYLTYPKQSKTITRLLLPYEHTQQTLRQHTITDTGPEQSLSTLLAYVKQRHPDGYNIRYYLQDRDKKKITIALSLPGAINRSEGKTQYHFNSITAEPFGYSHPHTQPAGNQLINWMFPLHNGEAFGLASKILLFITGFTPLLLYITSLLLWYKKWQRQTQRGPWAFVRFLLT